jgi:hypothetical protein
MRNKETDKEPRWYPAGVLSILAMLLLVVPVLKA